MVPSNSRSRPEKLASPTARLRIRSVRVSMTCRSALVVQINQCNWCWVPLSQGRESPRNETTSPIQFVLRRRRTSTYERTLCCLFCPMCDVPRPAVSPPRLALPASRPIRSLLLLLLLLLDRRLFEADAYTPSWSRPTRSVPTRRRRSVPRGRRACHRSTRTMAVAAVAVAGVATWPGI